MIASSGSFGGLIVFCIVLAGILVGVQSYPEFTSVEEGGVGRKTPIGVLAVMDETVQIIFTSECLFKIFAEGRNVLRYWTGPDKEWNNFDFWLVAICWLPSGIIGNVAFLRLLRLMRLLKLVGKVKELQLIVMGLVNGLNSVTYILILMLLIFYLFAVLGVGSFQENDPFHFGSLGVAMLTLFRCATLENWSQVMAINFYGCDSQHTSVLGAAYAGGNGSPPWEELGEVGVGMGTMAGYFYLPVCWNPKAQPALSAAFFILFVVIASFVMLSLFIGAVCGGMSDAMEEFKAKEKEEKEAKAAKDAERLERERQEALEDDAALATGDPLNGTAARASAEEEMAKAFEPITRREGIAKTLSGERDEDTELEEAEAAAKLLLSIRRARAGKIQRYDFTKVAARLLCCPAAAAPPLETCRHL